MDDRIENVARAFYAADDGAQVWEREPEILKEEFRRYAREAIALLDETVESGWLIKETENFSYAA